MSHTRKFHGYVKEGFQVIKNFTCLPWDWACGVFDEEINDQVQVNNHLAGSMTESVKQEENQRFTDGLKCCCRTPAACLCSGITFPLGGSSCVVLSVLGTVGTCCTAAADVCSAPEAIIPTVLATPNYNTDVIPGEHGDLKMGHDSVVSTPVLSPIATRK